MCILFLYQNNHTNSHYKLILAANRDEYLNRPSKPAEFLPSAPDVLCGIDLPDRNNGTWLGVNKAGKFAALTTVLVGLDQDPNKLSRGHIVMDYIKNKQGPLEYLNLLPMKEFREYNVLAGAVDSNGKVTTAFHSNCDGKPPRLITDNVVTVACTALDDNWRKMNHGLKIFEDLLTDLKDCPDHEHVSCTLLDSLLSDTTPLYPDPIVQKQANETLSELTLEKYCSVKIANLPDIGTREQTVILIDQNNDVHFVERSLQGETSDGEWVERSFTFKIDFSD